MSERNGSRHRRDHRRSDDETLLRFLEEFSWLLSSYDGVDFKALKILIERMGRSNDVNRQLRNYIDNSRNSISTLIGTLPSLLKDERLFPANEDIVEFSRHALGIEIPRWQKKSKYELIGHVVCHTEKADSSRLDLLMRTLGNVVEHDVRNKLENQRKSGMTWNEVIQNLYGMKK